jgi:hypothetical protein
VVDERAISGADVHDVIVRAPPARQMRHDVRPRSIAPLVWPKSGVEV